MSYVHLTIEKRSQIEVLRKECYSIRRISALVGIHYPTVSRKLLRTARRYSAIEAHQDAMKKSSHEGRPSKLTISVAAHIESRLQQTWSPEQIVGAELTGKLSVKIIYNWLHRRLLNVDTTVLRRKGRPPRTQEKRGRFIIGRRIKDGPYEINTREVFGHGN